MMKRFLNFFKGMRFGTDGGQTQVNDLIRSLNGAALSLWGAARAETMEERERIAFSGIEDLRAVRDRLAEMGMEYRW